MTIKTFLQRIVTSFVVLSFVLLPTQALAIFVWEEIQPAGDTDQNWTHFSSDADGSNLIVAVNNGRLYTSSDGGANWTERQPAGDTDKNWSVVDIDDDGSNLIAGVNTGRLYTSSDGGANWIERQPAGDVDQSWQAIASDADGSNLIAGAGFVGGRLYTSSDGGANWIERQPAGDTDISWFSAASDADGSNLIVGVDTGRLYTSSDGGANWIERQPAGDTDAVWRVGSDSDGSNLTAANNDRLYTSSDGGANWIERQPAGDTDQSWTGISSNLDGSRLITGVQFGRVYMSNNGGGTWIETRPAGDADIVWVHLDISADGETALAGVPGGRIYRGSFVPDETAPTISSLDPEDDATGVETDYFAGSGATIEFDEVVVTGTGSVTIHDASDDSVVAVYDVEDENYVTVEDEYAYIYTEEEEITLERETTYYILIDEGAFEDASGNPFAGIADETTWNFTTQLNPTVIIDEDFVTGDGLLTFEDDSYVEALAVQDDGKILAGGYFDSYDGDTTGFGIVRINTDGSLDETFVTGDGFDDGVNALVIQDDGKILVGGFFSSYDGDATGYGIARLNTDGSLDETFVTGDGFDDGVNALVIQDDGKILVGGDFNSYDSDDAYYIARLNTDGSLDETFVTGDGFGSSVYAFAIDEDGKILVGGSFTSYDSDDAYYIARLNADGSLDETFVTGDGFDSTVPSLVIDEDGKILVGGDFTSYDGDDAHRIARLNTDGSLDDTFTAGFNNAVQTLAIDEDDKIIASGNFGSYGTSFGDDDDDDDDSVDIGYGIARLNTDGSLDETFVTGDGFDEAVFSMTLDEDGKILVGGGFSSYDGEEIGFGIARLIPPIDDEEEPGDDDDDDEEDDSSSSSRSSHRRSSSAVSTPAPTGAPVGGSVEALMEQLVVLLTQLLEQLIAEQQGQ